MYHFKYATKNEKAQAKKDLMQLINNVQDEVRKYFTFRFDFIGSEQLNMVTYDIKSNIGYDFDVNIRVNDEDENYSPKRIKEILMSAFNKYNRYFNYDFCEDSKRVITIKVKDRNNSKILHSCDFAIVNDCSDGRQQYIRNNKNSNSYSWEYQPKSYYCQQEKIDFIKENKYWNNVRDLYLEKKNYNTDENKKSRHLRAEAINEIYQLLTKEVNIDE